MSQRKSIAPRRWLLATVVSFCLMLLSFPALAGKVQIRDTGGLFSPADTSALHGEGSNYPFDVRIVATSEFDQKSDFDRYVRTQVNEPNMVVVGVDKAHRFTSVHFGTGLGVDPSQYRAVEQAGSPGFRDGNWKAGVEAILGEAKLAAHPGNASTQPGATNATNARSTTGSTVFMVLIVVLVVGGLIAFVGSVLSRRARDGGFGSPGYPPGGPFPPGGPYPPGYGGPGYGGPGYGGGSGIGGNIASAGLGGLVGYELGKMAGEHQSEHHHRDDDQNSAGVSGNDDRDNYDAGGSTGGWDDGGGDSGGGGDWGGGGGDSGGGGSDW